MRAIVEFLQQYATLFTALGGIATVLGVTFGVYKASHNKQVRGLERRIKALREEASRVAADHDRRGQALEGQIKGLKDDLARVSGDSERKVWDLQRQLAVSQDAADRLGRDKVRLESELRDLDRQWKTVKDERAELKAKYDDLERLHNNTRARAEDLEQQLDERVEKQQMEVETREEQIRQLENEQNRERERTSQAEVNAKLLTEQLDQLNNQLDQVINQDERVWERAVTGTPFQPLSHREVPIIAVLNLKGGVGKTTITAHLAGLMALQKKKVLVIDADYQRNLSMLLVSDTDRKILHLERRTLQHFLQGPNHSLPSLLSVASEVSLLPACCVVTNSDAHLKPPYVAAPTLEDIGLEDVEMRLMAEWMFRQSGPDVRLSLREALHAPTLKEKGYRYVLINCPPRLSTACINALAASDFVLIPVLLDATSARSVPNLLRTLSRLRTPKLFPDLQCLGVVANGVNLRCGKPIAQQAAIWKELPAVCRVAWGSVIHQFNTLVPRSNRIAEAAGSVIRQGKECCLAIEDSEISGVFTALLQEITQRIDHESKQPATVSA